MRIAGEYTSAWRTAMSASANKQLVQQYLEALSGNPKPLAMLQRYVTDAALIEHISQVEASFPNYELVAHQVIADDDLVAVRGTFRGVHRGASFFGVEPAGVKASGDLMIVYRITDGRIAEHWLHFDGGALVAQLQQGAGAVA
jgi:predicted ester cyclase